MVREAIQSHRYEDSYWPSGSCDENGFCYKAPNQLWYCRTNLKTQWGSMSLPSAAHDPVGAEIDSNQDAVDQ